MKEFCNMDFDFLRSQIIGADAPVSTPFGERLMVYADYTASGRCLDLVEKYLQNLQRIYANTHTEDDISGRSMTHLLEQAENSIKQSVNAGPDGRIISVGSGATGAIDKALDGLISTLSASGEVSGKLSTVPIIHTQGKIAAQRVALRVG